MSDSGRQIGECQHARTRDWCVDCLREDNVRLRAVDAELVGACRAVTEHLSTTFPPYPKGESPFDKVRAALARATEDKP